MKIETAATNWTGEEKAYTGPVVKGMRFNLGPTVKGVRRMGEVMSIRQAYEAVYDAEGNLVTVAVEGHRYAEVVYRWLDRFTVHYQSINPKTGKPWQSFKDTTPERVLANLVDGEAK